MKKFLALIVLLLASGAAVAQAPGVGLDTLPLAGTLSGSELMFSYQSGTGGSGPTVCARGWCPVAITPAQIANYIAMGGSLVLPVRNGGTGSTTLAGANITTFGGSIVSGHCAQFSNTTGTVVDAGAACGTGGGGGVTTFSFTNGNGFTGNVTNPNTTPALSLVPSFTGIAYSDGTQFLAAIASNFPTLNQSTTGNAATATALAATPTLCSAGQAAGGIIASGNATGCFTPTGSGTVNSGTGGDLAYYATTGTAVSQAAVGAGLAINAATLAVTQTVNPQTGTSYALLSTDATKLVTFNNASAVAVTIAQAGTTGFGAGYALDVQNIGAGTVTITPATSTINGASSLAIAQNLGCSIVSDGTNYQVSACTAVGSSGSSKNIQTFTSSGTWTKPSTGTSVHVMVCGAGGGGGSGAVVASGTAASGGGGGGGGACNVGDFPLSAFSGNVTVTLGAGGTGGTAASGAPGTGGNEGGNSTFGAFLTGYGGGHGQGGQSAANTGGGGGGGIQGAGFGNGSNGSPCGGTVSGGAPSAPNCGAAGGSNNNGAAGGNGSNGGSSGFGGAGAGAGGGVTTAPAGSSAGTGGSAWYGTIAGGAATGGAGSAPSGYGCGSAGGGTPGVTSGNSVQGGAGGLCAGGGGSGAALTTNSSGAGGLGGGGFAVITTS